MKKIPFVVGLVADSVEQVHAQESELTIQVLMERLACLMPDTPIVFLSLLRTHHEVTLAKAASRQGAHIWYLKAKDAGLQEWGEFVQKQMDLPPTFTAVPGEAPQGEELPLAWLVAHCHLLLAVSNGATGLRAKTAHRFRIHSIPPELGGKRGFFLQRKQVLR